MTKWQAERLAVWERESGLCGFCSAPVSLAEMDLDHLIPIKHGGTDDPSNLRPAHRACNRAAGGRLTKRISSRADRLSASMPPELMERLRWAARQDHRTLTSAVERAIALYCDLMEAQQGERTAA